MPVIAQTGQRFFAGTSISSKTYVYSATAVGGSSEGWKPSKADNVVVQLCVATLNATSMTIRVEGKEEHKVNRAASIYCTQITTAQTVDQVVNITGKYSHLRVGAHISPNEATPNNFYAGIILTETR